MFSNTMRRKFALTGLTLAFLFIAAKPAGAETILGSGTATVRIERLDASGRVINETTVEVQYQRLDLARIKLPSGSDVVNLAVHDVAGRRVRGIESGVVPEGVHIRSWDSRDSEGLQVVSGIYFLRLEHAGEVRVQKLVVLR